MIWNIIDSRKRPYRWKEITAIVEPVYHDNSVHDADQASAPPASALPYDHKDSGSVAEAVIWAQALPYDVTLYLYDLGEGIR